jgi:membrane dipeptidase
MPLVFDGHLDIAMNALLNERDQTLPVAQIRKREQGMTTGDPGTSTISLDEMRKSGIALCVATLIARTKPVLPNRKPLKNDIDFPTREMAYAIAHGQLAYYRLLDQQGHIRLIDNRVALDEHWNSWLNVTTDADLKPLPIGVIVTLEGADPIVQPAQVHQWYADGLRSLMLAHFTESCYAMGTVPTDGSVAEAPLTSLGRELLKEMSGLNMALDLTHLCEMSFFEAADLWQGPVLSSHSNCRALADSTRQLTDKQIKIILERDGVVGVAIHNWMLTRPADAELDRKDVGLDRVAEHIDHICQLAGDTQHAAIGSDLDGGYGTESCPHDLDTCADIAKIEPMLKFRGYTDQDVIDIFGGNWLRFYQSYLP